MNPLPALTHILSQLQQHGQPSHLLNDGGDTINAGVLTGGDGEVYVRVYWRLLCS